MGRILIGSKFFFQNMPNFNPKDIDELEIIDTNEFKYVRQISGKNRCLFQLKRLNSVQEYINWALQSKEGMVLGKFLVPEFCQAIGFTIQDLPQLLPLIDKLDNKHLYEKHIYESYIKNNDFILTDQQLQEAYSEYLKARGEY